MDAYLEIAKRVIQSQRLPLSAKKILEIAYKSRLIPTHLYGKTQYKTLQARISEDIRQRPMNSEFIRTEPGRFFLRDFLKDESVPEHLRKQFLTRPRKYELQKFFCLFIKAEKADISAFKESSFKYLSYKSYGAVASSEESIPLVSFSMFVRNGMMLAHRKRSRFRDPLKAEKSIGFVEYFLPDDVDIFHQDNLGLRRGVERVLISDLNGHELARAPEGISFTIRIAGAKIVGPETGLERRKVYMVFLVIDLDSRFDPSQRAAPMTEMRWVDIFNLRSNIDDLDALSKIAIGVVGNEMVHSRSARDRSALDASSSQ